MDTKTPTPAEYVSLRQEELDHMQNSLESKLAWIQEERKKLQRIAMIAGIPVQSATGDSEQGLAFNPRKRRRVKQGTMKAAVIEVLREEPQGLTALEILPRVNKILETEYVRSSLSPQLSRLKHDGEIVLDGNVWSASSQKEKPTDTKSSQDKSVGFKMKPSAQGREADDPGGGA